MQRKIKSYVLRAGRVSNRQRQGLDFWLKDYELTVDGSPWSLSEEFVRTADTVVEIGFGMGASLLAMAKNNPELNYIGIEVHQAGVGSLAADLHEYQISNVRIVAHDAVEVFRTQLLDNSLAGVQIFFPDPWHKKRHHKRRLIQKEFIQLLAKKIKPGGFIHCATDWQDYAEHILDVLSTEPTLKNTQKEGGYSPRPLSRPLTKFEQRGERLGHGVWDLIFTKLDA
ncbi:tRNA (guanosine(46)-N7)-methyltransferase TrmB [Legionella anisa]|uniref:tRNA (guanine-N(7)-)-methyltransferase n=1 Tax=Legionella anisa TaxID=28082 RepID=A0AAX0WR75_9GAMM|nr:tRNA (guanosine(46)-N7)-methyltransferase TrmB [Legionella anisa]AWN75307.1 tRNA (guanosine(46)-N7)-methyltransferase TrmB [Legionella anisa]KTC72670.1 tRNA (m7G46) methyltransferase, SAM-dependent [Legionella anisa]MBN5935487.1 tRNA (guanosine(46)-N7)-methyltransferase TrmB [Legionella anisa]MCW8424521.1 tRNA (guanosine(46)-N7)-methyltransferase TrmB [Legionella anisa]MCW8446361.1 tRNA (guanosine(46)-N7)-methyltransferase TrmB [Legionella anisa]